MSTQTEITRLETARNTLRVKAVELGIATSTAKLDALATAFNTIINRGTIQVTVQEGDSYTIQPGYYAGGTVSGVSGGGNYTLQEKIVTPTKAQQSVSADSGFYGLSAVTVNAIPDIYQDVSSVNATAAQVLANAIFVTSDGSVTAGTMPNNGAVEIVLSIGNTTYNVPLGFHNGEGSVSIVPETKTATPTKSQQNITPTAGKVLSQVTVAPIPATYQDVSGVTATASNVIDGDIFVNAQGEEVEGTMPNNGAVNRTMDGLTTTSVSIPAGYTSGGQVSLTNAIETALAAI